MIRARPETPIKDIMITDLVTVPTSASRDEVASTIARYDLMAVPVVDDNDRMKGIVTVDDTIDILLPAKLRKMVPRVGKSRSIHHTAQK
jgi:Mg/Co/Ni transporter MgtE